MAGPKIAREMRRDLHADRGAAFADFASHFFDVLDLADDSKRLGIHETVEEPPALDGAIFVQDRHRHVFHVVIERVTERDHLDERREEHEEKRHRVPQDGDEFLEQDRIEAAERSAFHRIGRRPKAVTLRVKAPNSKLQAPEKFQAPRERENWVAPLELDVWCFSGAWSLVFG